MDGPLVPCEGYTKTSVDPYQVCTAKHNIFYLQNDYKVVMKQTEVVLQQLLSYGKKEQAYCPQRVSELQAELKPSDSLLYAFNKVSIDFQSWFASQPCKCVK